MGPSLRTTLIVLAMIFGLAVLVSGFTGFWGPMAAGILIGGAVAVAICVIITLSDDKVNAKANAAALGPDNNVVATRRWPLLSWILALVVTGTAFLIRWLSARGLQSPLQLHFTGLALLQNALLILLLIVLLMLMKGLSGSMQRGERVEIESHWGGLGGGIIGWRLSEPLVYLMGIAFLLFLTAAVVWQAVSPPVTPQPGQQPAVTTAAAPSQAASQTP